MPISHFVLPPACAFKASTTARGTSDRLARLSIEASALAAARSRKAMNTLPAAVCIQNQFCMSSLECRPGCADRAS